MTKRFFFLVMVMITIYSRICYGVTAEELVAGPTGAALCGAACALVSSIGCGVGGYALAFVNPGVGIIYTAVCGVLATEGAVAGCAAVCMGLPTL